MRCCLSYFSHPLYHLTLHIFFKNFFFWNLLSAVLALRCCAGFSLVAASRGCASVAVHSARALGTGASGAVAPQLSSTGSEFAAQGFSFSMACGIFLDQRSNLCLLHWQADSLPPSHQGSPYAFSGKTSLLLLSFSISLSLSYTYKHIHIHILFIGVFIL